jgi:hypothetical protein
MRRFPGRRRNSAAGKGRERRVCGYRGGYQTAAPIRVVSMDRMPRGIAAVQTAFALLPGIGCGAGLSTAGVPVWQSRFSTSRICLRPNAFSWRRTCGIVCRGESKVPELSSAQLLAARSNAGGNTPVGLTRSAARWAHRVPRSLRVCPPFPAIVALPYLIACPLYCTQFKPVAS